MSQKPTILLIEDDMTLGRSLEQRFLLEGYAVRWATSATEGLAILSGRTVDMVLSDIRLPDGTGEDVVRTAFERRGAVPTIFMTAFGDIEQAVRLMKSGARDYIAKPFDVDQLVDHIKSVLDEAPRNDRQPFSTFGLSAPMRQLRAVLDKLARSDLPVLLTGETGTGKEVAARYLHSISTEPNAPFVAVNCAAVPSDLFESSLLGHERGAFSGAVRQHIGYAEQAKDGILFLDEVGELDFALQAKLLRLVETKSFQRVGGSSVQTCNARFVFATNRDLVAEVEAGRFREDLLFRINAVTCHLPPLRERPDEIAHLLRYFMEAAAERHGWSDPEVGADVLEFARSWFWQGNIREVRNRVERAVALRETSQLTMTDLWPEQAAAAVAEPAAAESLTLLEAREAAERSRIAQALEAQQGQLAKTANILGVSRTTLWHKIQKYRLQGEVSEK